MFVDYTSLVLQDFYQKQAANTLSLRLVHPTPAKLKKECVAVCKERFLRRDEKVLRTFFEHNGDAKSFVHAIQRCETDKFRPLVKFLKKQTNNTEEKNIELLAWLIDFDPRPFELGKRYDSKSMDLLDIRKDEHQDNDDKTGEALQAETIYSEERNIDQKAIFRKQITKFKTKSIIATVVILLSVGMAVAWLWNNKTSTAVLSAHERCMFWAGDHYESISCSKKLGDTLVVALDSVKLIHFKRITTPDTITKKSKGRVWYIKIKGNLEFYTTGGYHPIDPKLKLRPISDYIIETYIHPMREAK